MTLEKVFAIKAEPAAIWDALTGELTVADEGAYEVERAIPNELLSLWVEIQGGIRAILTYRLIPRDDHTEVSAAANPERPGRAKPLLSTPALPIASPAAHPRRRAALALR